MVQGSEALPYSGLDAVRQQDTLTGHFSESYLKGGRSEVKLYRAVVSQETADSGISQDVLSFLWFRHVLVIVWVQTY